MEIKSFFDSIIFPVHSFNCDPKSEALYLRTCLTAASIDAASYTECRQVVQQALDPANMANQYPHMTTISTNKMSVMRDPTRNKKQVQSKTNNYNFLPKYIKKLEHYPNNNSQQHTGGGMLASLFPTKMLKMESSSVAVKKALEWASTQECVLFTDLIRLLKLTEKNITRKKVMDNTINSGWFDPPLLKSYNINGLDLIMVPGMNLNLLLNQKPTAMELRDCLDLDARSLCLQYNMNIKDFNKFNKFTASDWIEIMGLNKNVLLTDFKLDKDNIIDFIEVGEGWSLSNMKSMGFTDMDFKKLNLYES